MPRPLLFFRTSAEGYLNRLGLGLRGKLILLFVLIKVVPLVLLALLVWWQAAQLGDAVRQRTEELAAQANTALAEVRHIAVGDAVEALDNSARENIERMTTDAARQVAEFLYARDADLRMLAALPQDAGQYSAFLKARTGRLVRPGEWRLNADKSGWEPASPERKAEIATSSNPENDRNFSYTPPTPFAHEIRPLFLEATYVGLDGRERLKVVSRPDMDASLRDVSRRENTYARAETYFAELARLKPGEIYVSDVIGAYVPSKVIGTLTPERAAKAGMDFAPEEQAYAGHENPVGKRFRGIVRWAAPVTDAGGNITGYVTLALDHDHIMEFTDHLVPTAARYAELPSAHEGNYAFIWDHKGRSIAHPRHHSIVGYHPETGEPQVPWLEADIYNAWQASGKSYTEFIADQPTFADQSVNRKPAADLTREGLVGLDCRYLNFAPQCTGWFDLTAKGGSGSFNILWSGLNKLTTAAAIPYYTGQYGTAPRGFGFVAVGSGLEEFHRPANETSAVIDKLIDDTHTALEASVQQAQGIIAKNLKETAWGITVSTLLMTALVVGIAIWIASIFTTSITRIIRGMARFRGGERNFRFNVPARDELGALCAAFDQMADTLEHSTVGKVIILNREGVIAYANDTALEAFGTTLNEIKGRPFAMHCLMGKNNPLTFFHEGRDCPLCYNLHTGVYRKCQAEEFCGEDGEVAGYVITATDVTDMVLKQKEVEEQRALLNTVLSCSPDIIWYKSAEGRFLAVSPRFVALCPGMERVDEVLGRTSAEVLPTAIAREGAYFDAQALEKGVQVHSERTLLFADGHTEVVDALLSPVFDQEGVLKGLLGVARDITTRVTMERDLLATQRNLKQAVENANRASESKSAFLARMSHEIRTPMNAVIGMSNIILRKLAQTAPRLDDVAAHARQIETSAQHLLGLINEILDISKIEAGKIELVQEAFDLHKLLRDVVAIMEPRCIEKCLHFGFSMEPLPTQIFQGDVLRLRQVLINLMGNAIKFTPEHGRVTLAVACVGQRDEAVGLEFRIEDSGIGISPEVLNTLFIPFEQGSGKITRTYGGTGLGLFISQSIVKLLGGEIVVNSREGQGSTFRFTLWLPIAGEKQASINEIETTVLVGKRVLVVDDIDINRLILQEMLGDLSMRIDEAVNGGQAVEMFRNSPENTYDAVLMDVQMPIMDGYTAARELRALPRPDAARVPIVALTANSFAEDMQKALASGMNAHLGKPVEYPLLVEILVQLCGRKESV